MQIFKFSLPLAMGEEHESMSMVSDASGLRFKIERSNLDRRGYPGDIGRAVVHAVNLHAELVDALRFTLSDIENMTGGNAYAMPLEDEQHPWCGTVAAIRAAIAKAEGREG